VNDLYRTGHVGDIVEERRNQISNSDRSDKRRTYKVKDNLVIDHVTNKSTSLKIYLEVR
jgi:protein subunit release factor A